MLVSNNPLKPDIVVVSNSGIDVAIPEILPIVFGFISIALAKFLKLFAKIYLEIRTISIEQPPNFINSTIIRFPFFICFFFISLVILPILLPFIRKYVIMLSDLRKEEIL